MATTMIVMINTCSFYQRDGTTAAINAPENLWVTKGIVGEMEIGDWFIIKRMVTAMAMAIATVWRKKGLDKGGGEGEWKDGFVFIHCFHFEGGGEDCFMLSYFVIVFPLSLFNAGWLISYQVQVNCWTVISCKISLLVQIWSSNFCFSIIVWESTVANSCIGHWHETGLQTFYGCPCWKDGTNELRLVTWRPW